jgi:tellurite resistance protein
MNKVAQQTCTDEQVSAWLRGLLTIAWADGHFDEEEKELVATLTQEELAPSTDLGKLDPIEPEDLANILGRGSDLAENFLRTAVMMAVANGVYSQAEADAVHAYHEALGLNVEALKSLEVTLYDPEQMETEIEIPTEGKSRIKPSEPPYSDVLQPMKDWLEGIEVHDPRLARFICKTVPSQCPFERDVKLFGHKVIHIPPLCKLNPLYEQLVGLRFRALSYLADECQEDVNTYV